MAMAHTARTSEGADCLEQDRARITGVEKTENQHQANNAGRQNGQDQCNYECLLHADSLIRVSSSSDGLERIRSSPKGYHTGPQIRPRCRTLPARLADKLDAFWPAWHEVARKVVGAQKQEYAAAGLLADEVICSGLDARASSKVVPEFPGGATTTQRLSCSG